MQAGAAACSTAQCCLHCWRRQCSSADHWLLGACGPQLRATACTSPLACLTRSLLPALQSVVEKMLLQQGVKRLDMGREKFEEQVWAWKNE